MNSLELIEWEALKSIIIERDGFKCARCETKQHLSVHHIKPRTEGGTNSFYNLITLCNSCHDLVELEPTELFIKVKTRKAQRAYYNRHRGLFAKPELPEIKLQHKGSILCRYFKSHPLTKNEHELYNKGGAYSRYIWKQAKAWYKTL